MSKQSVELSGMRGRASHNMGLLWFLRPQFQVLAVCGLVGCGGADEPVGPDASPSGGDAHRPGDAGTTADALGSLPDAPLGADGAAPALVRTETFPVDGSAWPQPWIATGGVLTADVVGGRGRLTPVLSNYSLARLYVPGDEMNVDVRFELEFAELGSQGLGFYTRQNGGYLHATNPTGAGYGVFIEGFRGAPAIGLWREVNGDEIQIQQTQNPTPSMSSNVVYAVRFQVTQQATSTRLRAKIWPSNGSEPSAWAVQVSDPTPSLQNLSGGFAVDAWSSRTTGGAAASDVFFDNLTIHRLP